MKQHLFLATRLTKIVILTLAVTVVAVVAAGNASAALISFSSGLTGESLDPWPNSVSPPLSSSGVISINQFNTSLGTLNSVTLDLSSVFNYGTQFENKSTNSGSTGSKTIDQRLIIGDPSLLDTGLYNYTKNWSVASFDGIIDYAGTSGFTASDSSPVTQATITFTLADMNPYIGTGNLALEVFSNASFSGGFTGGNATLLNTQNFVTNANVTYDYTPVPIPAAVWLLGTGLVGLVAVRRKAKM